MTRRELIQNSSKSSGFLRFFMYAIALGMAAMGSGKAYSGGLVFVAADSAPTACMRDGRPSGILVDMGQLAHLGIGTIRDTRCGIKVDRALKTRPWSTVADTNNGDRLVGMLVMKSIDQSPSYLAFTKQSDHSEVIANFDRALTSMKNDHRFNAIHERYLGPTKSGP